MKLIDQFLVTDRILIVVSTILILCGLVMIATSVKNRHFEKIKISSIVVDLILILIGLYSYSFVSLPYQIGQVAKIDYLTKSITFNVKNGEKIKYKYDESAKEYSSTNNKVVEGLNEIAGRYDFTYMKEIEQTGTNEWMVTFKCDCGKVKSVTIGE